MLWQCSLNYWTPREVSGGDALKVKKWPSLSFDHGPPSWGVRGPSGVRGLTSDEVLASGILAEQWSIGK